MYRKKTKAPLPKQDKKVLFKTASLYDDTYIRVVFPFSQSNLEEIRTIEDRKWNKDKKHWLIPRTLKNAFKLKKWEYIMKDDLKDWANEIYLQKTNPKKELDFGKLTNILYPYQKEGVLFIENNKGKGLIADEMGLGKTLQAIAYTYIHSELKKILVVCPASLKYNWKNEFIKWSKRTDIEILTGSTPYMLRTNIIIINYDIVTYWAKTLKQYEFDIVILDESHYIKNNAAKRTKAVKSICKTIPKLIALTGTPVESKPLEIYNSIQLIKPALFPNKWVFMQRYCNPKHNGFGWDFSGASNIEELHTILKENIMIRRKKKDVLLDLPDKTYTNVMMPLSNRKEYDSAEHDFINYVKNTVEIDLRKQLNAYMTEQSIDVFQFNDHKLERLKQEKAEKATPLAQIEALKQLTAKGKLKGIIQWIEDFIQVNDKLVVFTTHRFVIDALYTNFSNKAVKVDGSVPTKERQKAVDLFQNNNKISLFLGNIKAAGVGLTLTASSNVAICEFPWAPGELNQAIDRVHRISQRNAVNVYYLIAKDSIDVKILDLLQKKQRTVDAILDGKETEQTSLLTDLINSYTKRR